MIPAGFSFPAHSFAQAKTFGNETPMFAEPATMNYLIFENNIYTGI